MGAPGITPENNHSTSEYVVAHRALAFSFNTTLVGVTGLAVIVSVAAGGMGLTIHKYKSRRAGRRAWHPAAVAALGLAGAAAVFGLVVLLTCVIWGQMPREGDVYLSPQGRARMARNRCDAQWKSRLYATYPFRDRIPARVFAMIQQYAPEYDFTLHDDAAASQFIADNFTPRVVRAFRALHGAHRADLIRFCWLYVMGGTYIDIKTLLKKPISVWTSRDTRRLVSMKGHQGFGQIGLLSGAPGTRAFGYMVHFIVDSPAWFTKVNYHIYCRLYSGLAVPRQLARESESGSTVDWIQENCDASNCTEHSLTPDRYGLCCTAKSDHQGIIAYVRDPTYPWH